MQKNPDQFYSKTEHLTQQLFWAWGNIHAVNLVIVLFVSIVYSDYDF